MAIYAMIETDRIISKRSEGPSNIPILDTVKLFFVEASILIHALIDINDLDQNRPFETKQFLPFFKNNKEFN